MGLITCPNCGHKGVLVVGRGLYPFVAHRFPAGHRANPHLEGAHESECFLKRDDPAVVRELEKRASTS